VSCDRFQQTATAPSSWDYGIHFATICRSEAPNLCAAVWGLNQALADALLLLWHGFWGVGSNHQPSWVKLGLAGASCSQLGLQRYRRHLDGTHYQWLALKAAPV